MDSATYSWLLLNESNKHNIELSISNKNIDEVTNKVILNLFY